jgi:predicted branched-subunit amino acid permease
MNDVLLPERRLATSATFSAVGVTHGLRDGLPLAISVLPWGIAYGVVTRQLLSLGQLVAMSGYVYSGSAQLVALDFWKQPLATGALLLAVFGINARYLLQGVTLAPWVRALPVSRQCLALFFLSDTSWAVSLKRFESGRNDVGYLFGTSVAIYVGWVLSTLFGFAVPVSPAESKAWGLDFAVAAAIIALAGGRWAGRKSIAPWLVAAATAFAAHRLLGGNWYMFVGGVAGAVTGALQDDSTPA